MKQFTLATAVLAAVLLAACGPVKIGRITADPGRYRNHTVQVTGRVVNSFGVLGTGGYQIEDETGKIYVISRSGVPSRGTRVTVKGTVLGGITVMGQSFGTSLREERHRIK